MNPIASTALQSVLGALEAALTRALEELQEEVFAERACLVFLDDYTIYHGTEELREAFPFSRKVVEGLLEEGIGLVSFDPQTEAPPSQSIKTYGLRAALAAAVEDNDGLLGILYFDNRVSNDAFSTADLETVREVAEKLAPLLALHLHLRGQLL